MTTELNSIVFSLNAAINESQEIVDMTAVTEAVGQLENFPMTMELLQITRIGKLLNTIRKQTDRLLQSRIRHVIRCWQELVKKAYQSIIPKYIRFGEDGVTQLDNSGTVSNTNGSNGTLPRAATITQLDRLARNSIPVSPALSQNSVKSTPCTEKNSSNYVNPVSNRINNKRSEHSLVTNETFGSSSPKRMKFDDSSSSALGRAGFPTVDDNHSHKQVHVSNGFTEKSTNHRSNQSVRPDTNLETDVRSVTSDSSNPNNHPISIAPKVKSTTELLAMFTSSVSRDIVTKIIRNEISKEPEMPESALPESARPRQYKSKLQKQGKLHSTQDSGNDSMTAAKSEILAKFLNNTIEFQVSPSEPSTPSLEKTKSALNCSQTSEEQIYDEGPAAELPTIDTATKKHKKHKKKRLSKKSPLPITNFLNDIPDLPPLPDDIDWHSLDYIPDKAPIDDLSVLPGLLKDNLPGVNCVLDGNNKPVPFTDMYSISLPDRSVHILPWTDLNGWQGNFLPDCDETAPPDPW